MVMHIDNVIGTLNNNKYLYAICMILLNVGAKYIEVDLQLGHKRILSSKIIRRLLIFTVAFIATRDVITSLIITASFVIIILNLFNTKSKFCVLPKSYIELDKDKDGEISPEEIKHAYNVLKKAGKIKEEDELMK